jgi:hypothetical protein
MPNYDFFCEICKKEQEVFMKISEYQAPECCNSKMKQRIGNYSVIRDIEPYMDQHLGTEPIWVKSKKHREKLMKEHGVQEKFGKNWW